MKRETNIVTFARECKAKVEAVRGVSFFWTIGLCEVTSGNMKGHVCNIVTFGFGDKRVSLKISHKWRPSRERKRFNKILQNLLQ